MIVIFDLNLYSNKKVFYLFTNVFGLGKASAKKLCAFLGVDPNYLVKNLPQQFFDNFQSILVHKLKYLTEVELNKFVYDSILLKKNIKSYSGIRHSLSLPLRGQRTRTNAKTMKWKRKRRK